MREGRGKSQADIARAAGVDPKQVYRWERGESEPSGAALLAFIAAVQGSYDHVTELLQYPETMPRNMAHQAAERDLHAHPESEDESAGREQARKVVREILRSQPPPRLKELQHALQRALSDSGELYYLLGYLAALNEQDAELTTDDEPKQEPSSALRQPG